jgi:hypothetical protein
MSKPTILFAGDSFVANSRWPTYLFPESTIINLAKTAAGNTFIADSIIHAIDITNLPDFVFILWGTITKIDITLPVTESTSNNIKKWEFYGKIDQTYYVFTGGDKFNSVIRNNYKNIKDTTWPAVETVEEYLKLPNTTQKYCEDAGLYWPTYPTIEDKIFKYALIQYANNLGHLENITYKSMIACQSFLESNNVPYRFGFTVNPFNGKHVDKLGRLCKQNNLYNKINWKNYIELSPHDYGVDNNCLDNDQFHLTPSGIINWAKSIKNYF